jgi:DNA-binding XRE family transcriptional regulator
VIIIDRRQLAAAFRQMRINRKLRQQDLAEKLFVHQHTISVRENHARLDVGAVIETAAVFGYDVALIPQRHPAARRTGTGWPA